MQTAEEQVSLIDLDLKATVMLVAGEPSGDIHGAELISALREQRKELRIIGCGGPAMVVAGQEQIFDLTRHAVFGLMEVAHHYFKFKRLLNRLLKLAEEERPEVIVLIDNSGFNLRLAAALRERLPQSRIVYFVSPQVWASREYRTLAMSKNLNLVLSIFPFEAEWYAKKAPQLPVHWVGHPLFDRLNLKAIGQTEPGRIALMPGSRAGEINHHLPILWAAARKMAERRRGLRFVLIAPNAARQQQALQWISQQPTANFAFESFYHYPLSHLNRCELALVKSGTASLDCAFLGVPAIVFYKVNPITYQIAKMQMKVKFISMVNLLAKNPPIVPEFIQGDFTAEKVAEAALELLEQPARRAEMKTQMAEVVASLGGPGASERAARQILIELTAVKPEREVNLNSRPF